MNKFISIFLCICTLVGMVGLPSAQAASESHKAESFSTEATSHLTRTLSITLDMQRNNSEIISRTVIIGDTPPVATQISAKFTLDRLINCIFVRVDSWTASSNSMQLVNSHTTMGCPPGTYRLSVVVTVISGGGVSETVSSNLVRIL